MSKLQNWFNGLTAEKQRIWLIGFCLVFIALLALSISYSRMNLSTGNIVQPRISTTK